MKNFTILAAAAALTACASNSGALKIGPDTYTVTASRDFIAGGAPGAQSSALREANRQCESMGREVMVTDTAAGFQRPHSTYRVTFRCLAKDDPTLKRPDLEPAPNIVIEDRRK
jgi:hypothetical protein